MTGGSLPEAPRAEDGADALARAILLEARSYVTAGWCRGASARDEPGQRVDPWNARAVSWSVIGALVAVWAKRRRTVESRELGIAAFQKANVAILRATGDSPRKWNDAAERTQEEALRALERATQLVR